MAEPRRRFRFLKELAQGGFGKVYLAEMITGDNFSSVVAIKVLHGRWVDNDEVVMRSRDEARLLGRLRHRSIVRVEDLTAIQGQCAIVMEYLQGVDLKNICTALREQGKTFPRQAICEVIGGIAAALDAAYNHKPLQGGDSLKVIHRDIKPSNAMITIEGDVKVLDFGTARANFDDREAKTQALAFGSAAYMAPERLMGEEDRPAGDIFSLGVTLYEMLTLDSFGKIHIRPERFEKTVAERLGALDLSAFPESIHDEFREAMRLMLAYEPENRPTSAEVVELMEAFGEQARDGGLKRFSREIVKDVIEAHIPEQDPNDPLTGQLVYEDSGGFATNADGTVGAATGTGSSGRALPKGATTSQPKPTTSAPSGAGPLGAPATSGVSARSTGSAPHSAPPPAPEEEEENPFKVPEELAEAPAELPVGKPSVPTPPTPPPMTTVTPKGVEGSPRIEPAPRPAPPPPEPEAPSGGGFGKVILGLMVLGFLGVVALGGAYVIFGRGPSAGPEKPPEKEGTPAPVADSKLIKGTAEMDWSPNADGKGGVILQVPGGATEVVVTSSTGFRSEWDGSAYLRLKDLEPGAFRGKVKPKSGSSVLADFAVEKGSTCVFTFNSGGGSWDKSECR